MHRLIFVLAVVGCLNAEWKGRAFPDWDKNAVLKMLVDSPWSHPKTVKLEWRKRDSKITYRDIPGADHNPTTPIGSPVGGIGINRNTLPDKADILVRWASALPVRQATGLYKQRDGNLSAGALDSLIPPAEADYVVELFGVPAELAHRGAESVEAIALNSAALVTRAGTAIRASRAKALVQGATMTVLLYFPKTTALQPRDEEVECVVDLQIFSLREKFKLSAMVYQGELAI